MRQNKSCWLAAVVLAGLVSAVPLQAAAPPVNGVVVESPKPQDFPDSETGLAGMFSGYTSTLGGMPWPTADYEQFAEFPKPYDTCSPEAPLLSSSTVREYTIVVRIEDSSSAADCFLDPFTTCLRSLLPPSHAVSRLDPRYFNREIEANAVLDNLQKKLMELHDKGCFEVEFLPREGARTEMRIRYNPMISPCEESRNQSGSDPQCIDGLILGGVVITF
jgi:hypothetical protein